MERRRSTRRVMWAWVLLILGVPVLVGQQCIPDGTSDGTTALQAGIVGSGTGLSATVGQSLTLQGTATGGTGTYTFSWSSPELLANPNSASAIFTPTAAGAYVFTLSVTDSAGASARASVEVTVTETSGPGPLTVDAGAAKTTSVGVAVRLDGSAGGGVGNRTYSWTPTTGLSNPNIATPMFTPASTGTVTFTLTVRDDAGTQVSDTVQVVVSEPTTLTSLMWQADYAAGGYQVLALFSHALNPVSAQTRTNYVIAGTTTNPTTAVLTNSNLVTLKFDTALASTARLNISPAGGLLDNNGNPVVVSSNLAIGANTADSAKPSVGTNSIYWGADFEDGYQVTVLFSEALDKTSAETLSAYSMNGENPSSATLDTDGKTVTLVFDTVSLSTTTPINVSVGNTIKDINGKAMTEKQGQTVQKNAADVDVPTIQAVENANVIGTEVTVEFNEAMSRTEAEVVTRYQNSGSSSAHPDTALLGTDGRTVTLQFAVGVKNGDKLQIGFDKGIKDINGNALPASIRLITGGSGDVVDPDAPVLTWTANRTANYAMTAVFGEDMEAATVTDTDNWRITGTTTDAGKPTTVTYDAATRTATLVFESIVLARTDKVDVSAGGTIRDASGNTLTQRSVAVNANTADTTGPALKAGVDPLRWVGNSTVYTLDVEFSEAMDETTAISPEAYTLQSLNGTSDLMPTSATINTAGTIVTLAFATTTAGVRTDDKLKISAAVRDINGRAVSSTTAVAVGTNADTTAPGVSSVTWAANAGPYQVWVQYNEVMDAATAGAAGSYTLNGQPASTAGLDTSGMKALVVFGNSTHSPADNFAFIGGLQDVSGKLLPAQVAAPPAQNTTDTTVPYFPTETSAVWEVSPSGFILKATFSEALDSASVANTRFGLRDAGLPPTVVQATAAVLQNGGTTVQLTFQSASGFTATAALTAAFSNALGNRDVNGNPTVAMGNLSRTLTLSPNAADVTAPTLAGAVVAAPTITLVFSESLDATSALNPINYQRRVPPPVGTGTVIQEANAAAVAFADALGTQVAVTFLALNSGDEVIVSRGSSIKDLNGRFMIETPQAVP